MNVSDLLELGYQVHTTVSLQNEFEGAYVGDLLSVVMKSAESGNLLVTILCNLNTVAVAVLLDIPVILFTENDEVPQNIIDKANQEQVVLFSTKKKSIDVIKELVKQGKI